MTASFPVPYEWAVDPEPEHVRAARHLLAGIVAEWGLPLSADAVDDLELCASEVIGNAIKHSGQRCRVAVSWTGERVRVEVTDNSLKVPELTAPSDTMTTGRGLQLVQELAVAWGWRPISAGKVTWFEIARDQATTSNRLAVLTHATQARAAHQLAGTP
ncbi:anti-sigma regulatory factor (Ser/Thr protein kinase) [Kitasatospora sp. MAP12-15]|uniref:ATP-binding protein n=1 Tax=unclassified Kitasatospora TaxID=2633591 RepID=UPI0024761D80|nr:ATP-binding protein [Kitasatospora sp. MAP12-44]MDH6113300.1 anti-sigma regulatory factor (Ser/Thr protein kinase) [Kitasatospora sp. MAP12-44]